MSVANISTVANTFAFSSEVESALLCLYSLCCFACLSGRTRRRPIVCAEGPEQVVYAYFRDEILNGWIIRIKRWASAS